MGVWWLGASGGVPRHVFRGAEKRVRENGGLLFLVGKGRIVLGSIEEVWLGRSSKDTVDSLDMNR